MKAQNPIIKCVILVSFTVITLVLCKVFPNAATDPQTGMVLKLPEEVPGHIAESREPGEKELYWLPKDTGILKRLYTPTDPKLAYNWIHATLILSGNDPRSLHRPEVCLDGQGWIIKDRTVKSLPINGQTLKVMDYTLKRNEKRGDDTLVTVWTHYVYWWIGKSRSTPHDWERILYTDLDNLFKNVNNRWGYPSVMVQVDPNIPDKEQAHAEASERAYDFIRKYAPLFQKSLAESSAEEVAASAP